MTEPDEGAAVRFLATTVGEMHADGYQPVCVDTTVGGVEMRYYPADGAHAGVVYVGGVGGGWDTPAEELYPRLCTGLKADRIAGLRVRFRDPHALMGSVVDVLAGIRFLLEDGVRVIGVVGHSFGGAVVLRTAGAADMVRTVVALATQAYGADDVSRLAPRCSVLLVHGLDDRVLPPECSRYVLRRAREPKRGVFLPGTGHSLNETADEVHAEVRDWLVERLSAAVRDQLPDEAYAPAVAAVEEAVPGPSTDPSDGAPPAACIEPVPGAAPAPEAGDAGGRGDAASDTAARGDP